MGEVLIERCDHGDCGVENRLEYCGNEPVNPKGKVAEVTDLIDSLLSQSDHVADSGFHASFGPNDGLIRRSFPELVWGGYEVLIETQVGLEHTLVRRPPCDRYAITIGTVIEQSGLIMEETHTGYSIDVYPAGNVNAMICAQDEAPRRMSAYDIAQLHVQLTGVAELHLINQGSGRV